MAKPMNNNRVIMVAIAAILVAFTAFITSTVQAQKYQQELVSKQQQAYLRGCTYLLLEATPSDAQEFKEVAYSYQVENDKCVTASKTADYDK